MARPRRGERRQNILETLAHMLEKNQGEHITTAQLARAVGVSEAALYRHFASKAKMFESLLEFIEETLFTRINKILAEESRAEERVQNILYLLLGFADKNPGMARMLYGDVLVGETERLRKRVVQIYERIETQLKQILREAEISENLRVPIADTAALFLAVVEGAITRYVRSEFQSSPVAGWDKQWEMLRKGIFS
ncbi:MAG: nucleoid occlusion factor SlmA [Gammaproteobacteria bacterium]|nr:nucleoid occlusion factor SlmA [Gammaproteobacteria bacterium]MDH3371470.1 nucleoid occlusion factor SlmA [Gammaproteobacteria bacterium]MDH3405336.1 nucleoid occlusion factor SlmA [Gammaproteobacteria bacterium]MDH3561797.1 nucleoid occlusion factor SlmA [Gammaproteobacteria bacterium]